MPEAYRPKGLSSAVSYQDAKAAFRWLEKAFGFEPLFVLLDAEGKPRPFRDELRKLSCHGGQ